MTPPKRGQDGELVRPYVVTAGRSAPSRNTFDHITLVIPWPDTSRTGLGREHRRVLDLCLPGALSVAEISGYLNLPVSVLRIVLADLMDSGHITTRTPVPPAHPAEDRQLLEEVLRGLRAL